MSKEKYCMYLRKSRSDDAQSLPPEEILKRHEQMLSELAERQGITVSKIYSEGIMSGESISSRPVMTQLLADVDARMWRGVLVTEFSRLARGNVKEQGEVLDAFTYSDTLIITPTKTYDLSRDEDETFTELGLMLSRQEYKAIRRRMEAGRIRSAQEGRFQGSVAPYGYDKIKLKEYRKACSLAPNPNEAPIVQLIYKWFAEDGCGLLEITRKLNDMAVPTRLGNLWHFTTVRSILDNPVYKGLIVWGRRKAETRRENGVKVKSRPRHGLNECLVAKGLHEPLVTDELWDKAQQMRANNAARITHTTFDRRLKNPFAGVIKCGVCGRSMVRKVGKNPNAQPTFLCTNPYCDNAAAAFPNVEKAMLIALKDWLKEYKVDVTAGRNRQKEKDALDSAIRQHTEEQGQLNKQISKLHDFLERGIYTEQMFLTRSTELYSRRDENNKALERAMQEREKLDERLNRPDVVPTAEGLLDRWDKLSNEDKNKILKQILAKATYKRDKGGRWTGGEFYIDLYPRI